MADVNRGNRPLSPHLQVYRLPIAAIASIMTRITGHALVAGIVLLVWWLVAAVASPGAFAAADWVMRSWIGFIVMTGSAWALWFHALSGVRHLFYDAGYGLEIDEAKRNSWVIIVGSVVMTLISLILFFIG
ncbi:MAG: succinate dehydrogenase, cytochrome b556 subunit [Paracoccus sp. (in: a-proteobacteria)]|jgi:succinate dehydrogenase / fumarate reductase cytochrome b subunit|uniref:succinate dehydrogenase, cytochrome b556 subunit n=1 Tax=unclassified Paracoccus (in: a-proteobacteria) TaxID=2688777 RepID=UPI000C5D4A95|nr:MULTISPECIES: succinate dehydrogenase, cytochrome b556 subunit [unclassified Paracoccus (in: a-proteobacteria)]MAN57866.1 succinate dehydrogenase, cytochrome b556 subunit [Paracoccus sp. (in: a-proteobacteria)]MDB2551165.1 succinate dehydrogenase, cytochrome b556 subunit [Paracoccus sp. (in: a-proteobacteria)]HIC67394.1 succinate dehydrogenase, cytochrome b556 subunit [Paracoccus sp. (in: a-proteobacteria)]